MRGALTWSIVEPSVDAAGRTESDAESPSSLTLGLESELEAIDEAGGP